uniref:Uncharacterized protein n=1 Tax=Micrurus corallinus TaxID=54390 RepID=A0A2D4FNK3_MICCO
MVMGAEAMPALEQQPSCLMKLRSEILQSWKAIFLAGGSIAFFFLRNKKKRHNKFFDSDLHLKSGCQIKGGFPLTLPNQTSCEKFRPQGKSTNRHCLIKRKKKSHPPHFHS